MITVRGNSVSETGLVERIRKQFLRPRSARRDFGHAADLLVAAPLFAVDAHVAGEQDKRHSVADVEGERLGDARRLAPDGFGCELDRGARLLEFHDAIFQAQSFEMLARLFNRHVRLLVSSGGPWSAHRFALLLVAS